MVKFCTQCQNLYNHNIDTSGRFIYQCKICGHQEPVKEQCIVINELNQTAHDYQLNPNMIYDTTLPRTRQCPCANPQCPSRESQQNPEIIIFQYNPEILTVGYMCTECQTYWKN